jgi:hypothetical protein
MLPCGHTFCTDCLGRFQVNECPNDRTTFQQPAHSLPKNFDLLGLVQDLASLQVGNIKSGNGVCPEHKETFRYFDTVCKRPICMDCFALKHHGHACQSLAEAATARRSQLQSVVERSQTHCSSLEAAAAAVAKMREEAEAEFAREKAAIGAAFAEVWLAGSGLIEVLSQVQRAVAARQRALESELEQLHRANASALAKLEAEQRAAAESMRSAGQALQAVIDRRVDAEAFGAADHEVNCCCLWSGVRWCLLPSFAID